MSEVGDQRWPEWRYDESSAEEHAAFWFNSCKGQKARAEEFRKQLEETRRRFPLRAGQALKHEPEENYKALTLCAGWFSVGFSFAALLVSVLCLLVE